MVSKPTPLKTYKTQGNFVPQQLNKTGKDGHVLVELAQGTIILQKFSIGQYQVEF